jgi:hypothetical protein
MGKHGRKMTARERHAVRTRAPQTERRSLRDRYREEQEQRESYEAQAAEWAYYEMMEHGRY